MSFSKFSFQVMQPLLHRVWCFDCPKMTDMYCWRLLHGVWRHRSFQHEPNDCIMLRIAGETHDQQTAPCIIRLYRRRASGVIKGHHVCAHSAERFQRNTDVCAHIVWIVWCSMKNNTVASLVAWHTPQKGSTLLKFQFQLIVLRVAPDHYPNPASHAPATSIQHLHIAILWNHPLSTLHQIHDLHVSTASFYTRLLNTYCIDFITCKFQQHSLNPSKSPRWSLHHLFVSTRPP